MAMILFDVAMTNSFKAYSIEAKSIFMSISILLKSVMRTTFIDFCKLEIYIEILKILSACDNIPYKMHNASNARLECTAFSVHSVPDYNAQHFSCIQCLIIMHSIFRAFSA